MAFKLDRFIAIAVMFLVAAIIAGLFSSLSTALAVTIVSCAFLLSLLIYFSEPIGETILRSDKGKLTLGGFVWEVRHEPVRAVMPEKPTNATTNADAVMHCNRGRAILDRQDPKKPVDLSAALREFEEAAKRDPMYWEPRLNISAVLLLQGKIAEAMAHAADIRLHFGSNPQAFAKATLIMAKIMELQIPDQASESQQEAEYQKIRDALTESIAKCPGHMTTRTSLGRVLLLANVDKTVFEDFLHQSLAFDNFSSQFSEALRADGLEERFRIEFPTLALNLAQRRPADGPQNKNN